MSETKPTHQENIDRALDALWKSVTFALSSNPLFRFCEGEADAGLVTGWTRLMNSRAYTTNEYAIDALTLAAHAVRLAYYHCARDPKFISSRLPVSGGSGLLNMLLGTVAKNISGKGQGYSPEPDNRFRNFECGSLLLGVSPERALLSFAAKHLAAYMIAQEDGRMTGEHALEWLIDLATYMVLLAGMTTSKRMRPGVPDEFAGLGTWRAAVPGDLQIG